MKPTHYEVRLVIVPLRIGGGPWKKRKMMESSRTWRSIKVFAADSPQMKAIGRIFRRGVLA